MPHAILMFHESVLAYMDQSPCFENAIRMHTATKQTKLTEFKQPSTAAALLGIHEKVFARVTGTVLVTHDTDMDSIRKINIGLQLKVRGVVSVLPICRLLLPFTHFPPQWARNLMSIYICVFGSTSQVWLFYTIT